MNSDCLVILFQSNIKYANKQRANTIKRARRLTLPKALVFSVCLPAAGGTAMIEFYNKHAIHSKQNLIRVAKQSNRQALSVDLRLLSTRKVASLTACASSLSASVCVVRYFFASRTTKASITITTKTFILSNSGEGPRGLHVSTHAYVRTLGDSLRRVRPKLVV